MDLIKRAWMKYFVGIDRALYSDDHERLAKAYRIPDPWDLGSQRERHRFDAVSEVIRAQIGAVDAAVEIGSGEGHHTLRLLECCGSVDGIECSAQAIARARKRCPRARFFQANFPELPDGLRARYDLAIASETLYYFQDPQRAVATLNRLGKWCLVTVYEDQAERLEGLYRGIPGALSMELKYGEQGWRLYLWQSARFSSSCGRRGR